MKFRIDDPQVILSHILLHDTDLVMAVAATPGWKEEQLVSPAVTFNGVPVPAEVFEGALKELYNQLARNLAEQYDDVEKEVQRRVEQRLKEEAEPVLNKLYDLQRVLEDVSDVIKPYWEK
jgi:hypothetical protein